MITLRHFFRSARYFVVVSVLLIGCCRVAIAEEHLPLNESQPQRFSIVVSRADNGRTIIVPKGARLVLTVEENPTTGYQWSVDKHRSPVLKLMDSTFSASAGEFLGRGGSRSFLFLADDVGKQRLDLRQIRPWDPHDVLEDQFTIDVVVREGRPDP